MTRVFYKWTDGKRMTTVNTLAQAESLVNRIGGHFVQCYEPIASEPPKNPSWAHPNYKYRLG